VTETKEFDFLYPALTCERFGTEYRWQLGQLLSFSGGQNPDDLPAKNSRFSIPTFNSARPTRTGTILPLFRFMATSRTAVPRRNFFRAVSVLR